MIKIDARVAKLLSDSEIAINAGSLEGVRDGDDVTVWREVEITDPVTDESLGTVLRSRLHLTVTFLEERFCLAKVKIQSPNIVGHLFGQQAQWITGSGVPDNDRVPLSMGDQVTIYSTGDQKQR
jgi:hypothetical protein